jgi:transposase
MEEDYRATLAKCCFAATLPKRLTLVLYDVTTLYFDVEKEDDFRIPGLSKERKLDPQITVGLLTDATGFPLEVTAFEGNRAEVHTIIPVLDSFRARHGLIDIVVVADAAMLSSDNLTTLEEMGYHYVVASRLAKCPHEVAEIAAEGELADGQIIEGTHPVTVNHKRTTRRVIYQYRAKRAALDLRNIEKVAEKAKRMVAGSAPIKRNRFLAIKGAGKQINWDLIASAKARAGIKGYVTDLKDEDAQFIIDAYHRLFQIEKSFRMSKSDLRARPIFHYTRDSIEAHLTIVFAALAISRYIQDQTGLSIKRFVQKLKVVQSAKLQINGKVRTIPPALSEEVLKIIDDLY